MKNTNRHIETQDLYNNLIEEVKHNIHKLKEYGLSEKDIASLLRSEQPLLQLTVSKNHRIFLGEKRTEVCMEPEIYAEPEPELPVLKQPAPRRAEAVKPEPVTAAGQPCNSGLGLTPVQEWSFSQVNILPSP